MALRMTKSLTGVSLSYASRHKYLLNLRLAVESFLAVLGRLFRSVSQPFNLQWFASDNCLIACARFAVKKKNDNANLLCD